MGFPASSLQLTFVRTRTCKLGMTESKESATRRPLTVFLPTPAFVTDNSALIFEEHQICSSPNLHHILQTIKSGGLFVEDENKFIFCNVLVGHQAKARFKISNLGKIACDVSIVVKPISNKVRGSKGPGPPWLAEVREKALGSSCSGPSVSE